MAAGGRAAIHPTKNEFYKQYYYLIESMSTCKSVILMLDTEENEEEMAGGGDDSLVTRMFKEFFDLVRSVPLARHSEGLVHSNIWLLISEECSLDR